MQAASASFQEPALQSPLGIPLYANADKKASSPQAQSAFAQGSQVGKKRTHRVLMLGSNRELALYRAEVLRHHGFEVETPAAPAEALAIIQRGELDVAVLSYTLPDTAVQQFAESVREHCPDRPVVAIAQTMRQDRRIAPDAVVIADNGPTELLTVLRKVLGAR